MQELWSSFALNGNHLLLPAEAFILQRFYFLIQFDQIFSCHSVEVPLTLGCANIVQLTPQKIGYHFIKCGTVGSGISKQTGNKEGYE